MTRRIDQLVIVAGGAGSRLRRSAAGDRPKALVTVGGTPVLHHQLALAARSGIRHVTILAGHRGEQIVESVGSGSAFGLDVQIAVEDRPLGTAGALLQTLESLSEQFLVLYGDLMLSVDLQRFAAAHLERSADLTVFAHPNDHPQDSDLLEVDAGWNVTAVHFSPHAADACFGNLVNGALYAVSGRALQQWAGQAARRDFVKHVMVPLVQSRRRVTAYRSAEYLKDMGTAARLEEVAADWRAGRIRPEGRPERHPAVFLDRDGTLNEARGYIRQPSELRLIDGVPGALVQLRRAGFRLVVLTNQPVIARGEATEADVLRVHRRLEWELGRQGAYLDGIYVCPHHPDRGFPGERAELKIACACRKPEAGLLEQACSDLRIDPAASWMVGDSAADIELARRAGLSSVLVGCSPDGLARHARPDFVAGDLAVAARHILQQTAVRA